MNRDGTTRPPAAETRVKLRVIRVSLTALALLAGISRADTAPPQATPTNPAWAPIHGPAPAFRIPIAYAKTRSESRLIQPTSTNQSVATRSSTASSVRTAGFTDEASLPSLLPLPASRLPQSRSWRCVEEDSATLLEPSHRSMPTVLFPAIIYRSPDVVVSIPSRPGEPLVQCILLTKITGEEAGETVRGNVAGTKVVLHGLTDGVYEIRYLTESGVSEQAALERPSDRRILIELAEDLPVIVTSSSQEKPTNSEASKEEFEVVSLDSFPLPPTISDQIAQGWTLMRKGAHYSALQRLLDALDSASAEAKSDRSPTFSDLVESSDASTVDATAQEIARRLGKRSEWAIALYGLGRVYNAIRLEKEPLVSHALVSAAVCFKAACLLDETLVGPANELGVALFDLDRKKEAKAAFQIATSTDDPVGAYNLGRCHEIDGEILDANDAFRRAIETDRSFLPAVVEWTRLQLGPDSTALYPDQFGNIVQALRAIGESYDEDSAEYQWAIDTLTRFSLLEEEVRLNQSSYVVRRLLPKDSTVRTSTSDDESDVKPSEIDAGANRPTSLQETDARSSLTPMSSNSRSAKPRTSIQPASAVLRTRDAENLVRQSPDADRNHPAIAIPVAKPHHSFPAGVK